ncbi:MAG: AAA family ATPase [SAR324 cluster bacterium]|nr:AAA family ATPase [SAR324 cluster bacterium]
MANDKKKNPIKFIVTNVIGSRPNTCYIIWTDWDDFGFKTSFTLHYRDSSKSLDHIKGCCRIMVKGQAEMIGPTPMPEGEFTQLPKEYCSLGNMQDYYEELMGLPKDIRENILTSLRDCAFDNDIYKVNKGGEAMKKSLLRDVEIGSVTNLFPSILDKNIKLTPYHFQYLLNQREETKIMKHSELSSNIIDVEVTPGSNPPSNIHVLIGRNGVGKTGILSGIVDQLTKNEEASPISRPGTLNFISEEKSEPEKFTNLVSVAFSAFDHFQPTRHYNCTGSIPCQYVGLKTSDSRIFKTSADLNNDFVKSIKLCLDSQRRQRWFAAMNILNSDPIFKEYELHKAGRGNDIYHIEGIFDRLSSGHKIILLTITKLVELVDQKTLVLIDEPESHLHPPLLLSFIRALSGLLIKRNAVALIATHSPIILQEVPKCCVTKIYRVGAKYKLNRPKNETYGENIDTLTRDVFGLELENSGFYKSIGDYIRENKSKTYKDVMKEFGDQVGSEGRAIARSLIFNRGGGDA